MSICLKELIGIRVKSARNRWYYIFTHSWIHTPEPDEGRLFHQANKNFWSSPSLWDALYFPLSSPTEAGLWFRAGHTTMTFIREVNISVGRARFTAGAEMCSVDCVETVSWDCLRDVEFQSFVTSQSSINCSHQYLCSVGLCPHFNEITGNKGTFWLLEL